MGADRRAQQQLLQRSQYAKTFVIQGPCNEARGDRLNPCGVAMQRWPATASPA
jgi:hypothetical protein